MRRCLPYAVFLIIVLAFGDIFYAEHLTRLPFGMHEWAQADRLALAVSYYDNGMNFFLPATLNQTTKGGIVGTEFPIQAYTAAALGHGWLLLMWFMVGIALICFFGGQLHVHDYYMLAICYPLIVYGLLLAALSIHRQIAPGTNRRSRRAIRAGLAGVSLMLLFFTDFQIYRRFHEMGTYAGYNPSAPWLEGGRNVLAQLGVPDTARIVALGEPAPNLSLVYFDRKGYNLPQDRFRNNLNLARDFMHTKQISYAVLREDAWRSIPPGDSNAVCHFKALYVGNNKAVLRLID